jgi:fatty-acyl-CoA synthase
LFVTPSSHIAWLRALELTAPVERGTAPILPSLICELAARFDNSPALIFQGQTVSFRALAERIARYARWSQQQDLRPGDVVCLLMSNCPEFLAIWLGLTRAGAVVALLNTNLTAAALAHSIDAVKPRYVIHGASLQESIDSARAHLRSPTSLLCHGQSDARSRRVDWEIDAMAGDSVDLADLPAPLLHQRALYIYTSGTTGMPKGAAISHARIMRWSYWFSGMMNCKPSDRMYDCLPLYHSVGGVVAVGATLVAGGSVVLRERFSGGDFWTDVVAHGCTMFQYIGELCRYLLNRPFHPDERLHQLRICCGNGLRPEVWTSFRERFDIPQLLEYYAATEGSFSLYNYEQQPGAIGRVPAFLAHRFPMALVRYDHEVGAPVRDAAGHCIRCATDEVGEAIGRLAITADGDFDLFEGYSDAHSTRDKLLHGVFEAGDVWYRSGDLMRRDRQGYFYFVDRVGDTYRWKGENVSTDQVTGVLASFPGILDAAVYGVSLPGHDGRAGMAALAVAENFDRASLDAYLETRLPAYARPLLLRIVHRIEVTATLKINKTVLAQQAYDPAAISDPLYIYDREARSYVPFDANVYAALNGGQLRV